MRKLRPAARGWFMKLKCVPSAEPTHIDQSGAYRSMKPKGPKSTVTPPMRQLSELKLDWV